MEISTAFLLAGVTFGLYGALASVALSLVVGAYYIAGFTLSTLLRDDGYGWVTAMVGLDLILAVGLILHHAQTWWLRLSMAILIAMAAITAYSGRGIGNWWHQHYEPISGIANGAFVILLIGHLWVTR